jgi:hypothetical protein
MLDASIIRSLVIFSISYTIRVSLTAILSKKEINSELKKPDLEPSFSSPKYYETVKKTWKNFFQNRFNKIPTKLRHVKDFLSNNRIVRRIFNKRLQKIFEKIATNKFLNRWVFRPELLLALRDSLFIEAFSTIYYALTIPLQLKDVLMNLPNDIYSEKLKKIILKYPSLLHIAVQDVTINHFLDFAQPDSYKARFFEESLQSDLQKDLLQGNYKNMGHHMMILIMIIFFQRFNKLR